MKNLRWNAKVFSFVLVILAGLSVNAVGQTKVALVDIGLVFKNHPVFSTELASLRSQADGFKAESQQIQQQLLQKAEVLNQYEKESMEYRDEEARLAQESATMEVEQRAKMRDLLKKEAQLHFDTYVEISNFISQYCEEHRIQLVLRFNSEEMNAKDPRTIMQKVNGGVVFHSQSADITSDIIQRIGQRQAANFPNKNR
ncbi:MAG: OmpH family outer membrane protein [Planctomycetota bacterium]